MRAWAALLLLILGGGPAAQAASSRAELLFELQTAVKIKDRIAFAECFNFRGTNPATQKSTAAMITQIFRWPEQIVTTSERDRSGKLVVTKNGRNWTLNGDWVFQVHFMAGKDSKQGFVFPAGLDGNQWKILLMIEEPPAR